MSMLEDYAGHVELKLTSDWLQASTLVDRLSGVYHLARPRAGDDMTQALVT
jgi:hypothetical protein